MKKFVFVLTVFCFIGCMQAPDKPQQPKVLIRKSEETPTKDSRPKPGGGDMYLQEPHLQLEVEAQPLPIGIDPDGDGLNKSLFDDYPYDGSVKPEKPFPKVFQSPKPQGDATTNKSVSGSDAATLEPPILDLKLRAQQEAPAAATNDSVGTYAPPKHPVPKGLIRRIHGIVKDVPKENVVTLSVYHIETGSFDPLDGRIKMLSTSIVDGEPFLAVTVKGELPIRMNGSKGDHVVLEISRPAYAKGNDGYVLTTYDAH